MSTLDPTFKRWRWRVFAATWLSYFGFYFARKPFYVVKSALTEELGWDPEKLGLIGACYLIAYMVGQFIAGTAGSRYGPRLVLLIGMATTLGVNVAFGLTNSWATFALLMTLNGLAQATGWSNNVGTMGQWYRRQERGTILAVWGTNYQLGGILATNLAALVFAAFGYRYAFFGGAAVMLVIWVFFWFNHRGRPSDVGLPPIEDEEPRAGANEAAPAETQQAQPGWPRALLLNVLLIGVFYFFLKLIRYAIWSWVPYMLETQFAMAKGDGGMLSTVFDVAGLVGVVVIGLMSDRWFDGRRAYVAFLFVIGLVISCSVMFLAGQGDLTVFAVCLGFIGFFLYGPDALLTGAGAIDVGGARHAVMAAAVINGMGSAGLVLGRLLKDGAVGQVFGVLLGSSVLSLFCILWMVWRNRTGRADL